MLLTVELRCNTWRHCLFLARGMSIWDASPCASVSLMFRLHKPERRHLTHPREGIVSLNLLLQGSPELRQALIGAIAAVGGGLWHVPLPLLWPLQAGPSALPLQTGSRSALPAAVIEAEERSLCLSTCRAPVRYYRPQGSSAGNLSVVADGQKKAGAAVG